MSKYNTYRYREMIYDPEFALFSADPDDELAVNGYFVYDITKMIRHMLAGLERGMVTEGTVAVDSCLEYIDERSLLPEHVKKADLERPIIFVEVAPDSYVLEDGRHRLCKAMKKKVDVLPAYFVKAEFADHFFTEQQMYLSHIGYWNGKIADYEFDDSYPYDRRFGQPLREWKGRTLERKALLDRIRAYFANRKRAEVELALGEGQWFTVSYNEETGKISASEAFDNPSVRCSTIYRMDEEKLALALMNYQDWVMGGAGVRKEIARETGRGTKYYMAIVRAFSCM